MDKSLEKVIALKIARAAEALKKNGYEVVVTATKAEALEAAKKYVPSGAVVGIGGSMSLFETGIIDWLRTADCKLLDRYEKGLTQEQMGDIFRKSLVSDVYITSTNAVTEEGELLNIDGRGNRVAAMIYGPKSVVVVAGHNKIAVDIEEAYMRAAMVAAPANNLRLGIPNPCTKTGKCEDCKGASRICNIYVTMGNQVEKGRIKVILCAEDMGY